MISYASIVWWEKTTKANVQWKLNKLQRLACLMTLGCSNLTPTAAMEVLVDIPPLHLFIRYDAMNMNLKFRCSEFVELRGISDERLDKTDDRYTSLQFSTSDDCLKRYIYGKKYDVEILEKEEWYKI